MPRERDDVDVLDKVFEESTDGRDFIIETEYGEMTFSMTRVSRIRRQEFISTLPDELVEAMAEQEEQAVERTDVEEVSDLEDIQDATPEDPSVPTDAVIGPDEVREFESLILDSFEHEQITDGELRDLMEHWDDKMFFSTAILIISFSSDTDGVESFRTE